MLKSIDQTQSPAAPGDELRIYLLGTFRVSVGQWAIGESEWRLPKTKSLLKGKLLALAPNHRLHREQVINLLWPDLEREPAANNPRRRACLAEGLRIVHDVGHARHISQGLCALGVLVMQQGDHERGVRLISAAVALHDQVGASLDADEKTSWDDSQVAARAALGETGFAAAWAEGQAMILSEQAEALSLRRGGIEQTIEYAEEAS
jgi:DNA-binding SARP family transcriptional activator